MQEKHVAFRELWHDQDNRAYFDNRLFTGIAVEHWPNGVMASETTYKEGIENGWTRGWYENGTPMAETFYVDGQVRGTRKEWHPSGALKVLAVVGDQAECIEKRVWDEAGNLIAEYKKAR